MYSSIFNIATFDIGSYLFFTIVFSAMIALVVWILYYLIFELHV